jgi:hypothetical protein
MERNNFEKKIDAQLVTKYLNISRIRMFIILSKGVCYSYISSSKCI